MQKLSSSEQFQEILEYSQDTPVVIFKHSTTCPISAGAYDRVESVAQEYPHWYLLIVQEHPDLKMEVADTLHVQHESPQVIVVNKGAVVYTASHNDITAQSVQTHLDSA